MPVTKHHTVEAGKIREGDRLLGVIDPEGIVSGKTRAHQGHAVEGVKTGNSNVTVHTAGGHVVLKFDADVSVARDEFTTEEKIERIERRIDEAIGLFIRGVAGRADAEHPSTLLPDSTTPAQRYGNQAAWRFEDALERSHSIALGMRMKDHLAALERESFASQREVFDAYVDKLQDELVRGTRHPSRSTSQCHNINDQVELQVIAKILEDPSVSYVRHLRKEIAELKSDG